MKREAVEGIRKTGLLGVLKLEQNSICGSSPLAVLGYVPSNIACRIVNFPLAVLTVLQCLPLAGQQ